MTAELPHRCSRDLPQRVRATLLSTAIILLAVACGPAHIAPFKPKARNYKTGDYAAQDKTREPSVGSVYSEAEASFLEDTRALRKGDIVMISIAEEANAQGDAQTDLSKSASREGGVQNLLGLTAALQKAYPDIDPTKLIALASKSDFSGQGKTARNGKLSGSIAVRVKREMPNGDLFVEGTKVVMINHEEYHIYISGVVRPSDIDHDNAVSSRKVADARVEFTGRGDINDTVNRGWLTRLIDSLNPF